MVKNKSQSGIAHLALILVIVIVAAVGFVGWRVVSKNKSNNNSTNPVSKILNKSSNSSSADAVAAGRQLSNNYCKGTGSTTFSHLPMDANDFNILIPYGLTVGGHVTPIDHQYFSPTIFNSPKDKYPVYAMADSQITGIEVHPTRIRLVFTVSCTFLYYYDLITSVEPGIDDKHLPIQVKAGQLIGHIGGQTLDFAVWNTEKPLSGFINPSTYQGEAWKIYTDNPFPYYTAELRQIVQAKDPRAVDPVQGKIDYDIDGKLVGNWFLEGSGGYHSQDNQAQNYWAGHLSIAPDLYDPSAIVVSVGNYDSYPGTNPDTSNGDGSGARQYFARAGSTDPAKVGQGNAVKYELVQRKYLKPDGSEWTQSDFVKGPKAKNDGAVLGTVLVQLTDKHTLKFEVFKDKNADQVSGFDGNAKTYTR